MTYGVLGALPRIIAGRPHGSGNGLQVGVGVWNLHGFTVKNGLGEQTKTLFMTEEL
jgi:hypothetical protein